MPLHIVGHEPLATERAVADLVATQPELQQRYGGWVASLHPRAWQEVEAMVRKSNKGLNIDLRPAINSLGLEFVIQQVGLQSVVATIGPERCVEALGPEQFVEVLDARKVIQAMDTKRVVEALDTKKVLEALGLDEILANLSPAERRDLKRRLQ